jgi:lipopolysaccharide transport system permease protein
VSYVNIQNQRLPFAFRYLGDLIAYRHLCWNLVGSDLRSRFRRTRLGILWAVIQPLAFALVIAGVWGAMQRSLNYLEFALYVFTGTIVFDLFTTAVNNGQDALLNAAGFVRQARIPFLIFQIRSVLTGIVMLGFSLIGVFAFAAVTGHFQTFGLPLVLVPAFVCVAILFMLPIAIIMSNIGAMYRDVRHIAALAERAIYMISPVFLPREILASPHLQFLEVANPLVPFIDMFRDPVMNGKFWELQDMLAMGAWIVGLWALAITVSVSNGRKLVFAL